MGQEKWHVINGDFWEISLELNCLHSLLLKKNKYATFPNLESKPHCQSLGVKCNILITNMAIWYLTESNLLCSFLFLFKCSAIWLCVCNIFVLYKMDSPKQNFRSWCPQGPWIWAFRGNPSGGPMVGSWQWTCDRRGSVCMPVFA